jgi:hypothetical protein
MASALPGHFPLGPQGSLICWPSITKQKNHQFSSFLLGFLITSRYKHKKASTERGGPNSCHLFITNLLRSLARSNLRTQQRAKKKCPVKVVQLDTTQTFTSIVLVFFFFLFGVSSAKQQNTKPATLSR